MSFIKYTAGTVKIVMEYFQCVCFSDEHMFKLYFDKEDKQLHLIIFLRKFSFFRRIMPALKYLCGHESSYGHFDDFIFKKEDVTRLKNILEHVEKEIA